VKTLHLISFERERAAIISTANVESMLQHLL